MARAPTFRDLVSQFRLACAWVRNLVPCPLPSTSKVPEILIASLLLLGTIVTLLLLHWDIMVVSGNTGGYFL
jgi:hypothetical protein